jgi:glycosyltransferase involved in cell wall biosynthesis
MRVVLADPPAFTPPYDHELAAALARAGADVTLVTSRFRFGDVPVPDGYRRREPFYPLSSRLFQRSRLLRPHVPSVFTAHDLLPRRTAARQGLWRELMSRFDRVVVHSENGRATLADLGVDARVIPHPVFRRDVPRADDGRTVLALGVIRDYKGLPDAIEATRRAGARLLVAGDPLDPVDTDAGKHVEWRLGYLPDAEIDRALSEATVAVFPYQPELDQSGALLRALGAAVPVVAYDVGGIAEPVRRFGAGRVVEPGDVVALAAAIEGLLADPAEARAGALRARDELTWDASAAAHLALYGEIA